MFSSNRQEKNDFIENQRVKSKFEIVITYLRNPTSFFLRLYVFIFQIFKNN